MRRVRLLLYAMLNLAVGGLVVAAISLGSGSAPDLRELDALEERLREQFAIEDLRLTFRSGPRDGDLSLALAFTADEAVYTDHDRLERLVDALHRRAVLEYHGTPAGVYVEAQPPGDLLLVSSLERRYVSFRSLQEMLDSISGADLLAYGNARWGVADLSPRWQRVIIHHSATESGSAHIFDRYHREHKHWEGGLGYHFVIGNGRPVPDGFVEVGSRWHEQADGAHAGVAEMNQVGIGVCVVGNFDERQPTERQMASLRTLLRWLHLACGISYEHVMAHRDVRETECPGKRFPMDELVRWLHDDELSRLGLASD